MKIPKNFLTAILLLLPTLSALAGPAYMSVTSRNGETVNVELLDKMNARVWSLNDRLDEPLMLSVCTGNVDFEKETGKLVTLPANDYQEEGKIWFEMKIVDINDIKFVYESSVDGITPSEGIEINISDGKISLAGVESPVKIYVFTPAGLLEESIEATCDMTVDVSRLGAGVHIVKVGETTFKILTK